LKSERASNLAKIEALEKELSEARPKAALFHKLEEYQLKLYQAQKRIVQLEQQLAEAAAKQKTGPGMETRFHSDFLVLRSTAVPGKAEPIKVMRPGI